MLNTRLDWHGDAATKAILDAAWEVILRATVLFWKELQLILAVPADWKWRQRIGSRPGASPRKRTGWLQKHVVYEQDKAKLTTRVGLLKNAIYGLYLEQGTGRILPRPWFLVTLRRLMPKLQAVLGTGKVG